MMCLNKYFNDNNNPWTPPPQVCKQLYVMADLHSPANSAKLDKLS